MIKSVLTREAHTDGYADDWAPAEYADVLVCDDCERIDGEVQFGDREDYCETCYTFRVNNVLVDAYTLLSLDAFTKVRAIVRGDA